MTAPFRPFCILCFCLASFPLHAGSAAWHPGVEPLLVLSLGDDGVKKTFEIPAETATLKLTVKKFLLDDPGIVLVWKNNGEAWMSQAKKIPGDQSTETVVLPPGRQITLEISTFGGTPVASIKLQRK